MKEHYVSFECAKRLKALGFRWKVDRYYTYWYESEDPEDDTMTATLHRSGLHDHNGIFNNPISEDGIHYSAPRLDQAAAWMREVKEIDVLVFNCACGYGWEISKAVKDMTRGTGLKRYDYKGEHEDSGMWLSYESALSAGISKALELLGEEVKNGM